MIFHIIGPSGSGKTTLGTKLSKQFDRRYVSVIDTDDIDDPNSVRIIDKYDFETKSNINAFVKELGRANKTAVDNVLKKYRKQDPARHHLIFVGFCHVGMGELEKLIDYGFSIEVEPTTLWRQYNSRTAAVIKANYAEITRLLSGKFAERKIHCLFSKKFGIRNGFDCAGPDDMVREIKGAKKHAKRLGYKYTSAANIYKAIVQKISK